MRIYAFQSKDEIPQYQAALAEWQAYIEGFASIEEVRLHVDRLEKWQGTSAVVARVRYELIGVPKGEPRLVLIAPTSGCILTRRRSRARSAGQS